MDFFDCFEYSVAEPCPLKRMWGDILIQAMHDTQMEAAPNSMNRAAFWQVKNWVDSIDFMDICGFAGVEHRSARKLFKGLMAKEPWALEALPRLMRESTTLKEEVCPTKF